MHELCDPGNGLQQTLPHIQLWQLLLADCLCRKEPHVPACSNSLAAHTHCTMAFVLHYC